MMHEFCTSEQVQRIYLELPITEVGNLLANYNICKEDHEKFYLDKIEDYINKRLEYKENADAFYKLIIKAKTHRVKLIAIDGIRRILRPNEQSIFSTGAEGVGSHDRLSGDNAIAKFIQYQQHNTEDKFVVFYGAAHAKIAQDLNIPSMYLAKYPGMQSYDYDEYAQASHQQAAEEPN